MFAIYNVLREPAYVIDKATCMTAMQAPVLDGYAKTHKKSGYGGNATVASTTIMRAGITRLMGLELLVAKLASLIRVARSEAVNDLLEAFRHRGNEDRTGFGNSRYNLFISGTARITITSCYCVY